MKKRKKENNSENHFMRCPDCGHPIPLARRHTSRLRPVKKLMHRVIPLKNKDQIVTRGNAALEIEASKHGWSVFQPVTPDVGTDYIIAKEYGVVIIQLKTATMMEDSRYHDTIDKFLEGPFGVIVYYLQNIDTFFLIPSTKFWEIPRFKKLKSKVFDQGEYSDTMSYETAKEVMGDYEGEKGWAQLEKLTSVESILQAIKEFIDKQKASDG